MNWLFLGDYVDRGMFDIEVTVQLLVWKIRYPKQVVLLRGNHETRICTTQYTFRTQVMEKYDVDLWERFMEVFDTLPLACKAGEKILGLHGGIS